jgi:hypothetical protein
VNGIRARLTFANVMSLIAVFIALSGIGYAAFKLPKNSVGPKQIRNGAVSEAKLSASAKAALKGSKGDQGPPGPGATCTSGPLVVLRIETTSGANNIQVSGTATNGLTLSSTDVDNISAAVQTSDPSTVDYAVVARDKTVGPFARLDLHAHFGSPCTYWGMITPSA